MLYLLPSLSLYTLTTPTPLSQKALVVLFVPIVLFSREDNLPSREDPTKRTLGYV